MPNGPMSKGASPTNDPMANGLELPEASNAEGAVGVIAEAEAVVVDEGDAEAPRRKTPNNHRITIFIFFPTSRVRQRIIAIQTLSAPRMVQQHHHRCL